MAETRVLHLNEHLVWPQLVDEDGGHPEFRAGRLHDNRLGLDGEVHLDSYAARIRTGKHDQSRASKSTTNGPQRWQSRKHA